MKFVGENGVKKIKEYVDTLINTLKNTMKLKMGYLHDATAISLADLWDWGNTEKANDGIPIHSRTVVFSSDDDVPLGCTKDDTFTATVYVNTSTSGYVKLTKAWGGKEYLNYKTDGTWSGWDVSTMSAYQVKNNTRESMWLRGDGIYNRVTWASSDYPPGVTGTGITTTVIVAGNGPAHNYGTMTVIDQVGGVIGHCKVNNNVPGDWETIPVVKTDGIKFTDRTSGQVTITDLHSQQIGKMITVSFLLKTTKDITSNSVLTIGTFNIQPCADATGNNWNTYQSATGTAYSYFNTDWGVNRNGTVFFNPKDGRRLAANSSTWCNITYMTK